MRTVVVREVDVREPVNRLARGGDSAPRRRELDPRDLEPARAQIADELVDRLLGEDAAGDERAPLTDAVTGEVVRLQAELGEDGVEEPVDPDDPEPDLFEVLRDRVRRERSPEARCDVVDARLEGGVDPGEQERDLASLGDEAARREPDPFPTAPRSPLFDDDLRARRRSGDGSRTASRACPRGALSDAPASSFARRASTESAAKRAIFGRSSLRVVAARLALRPCSSRTTWASIPPNPNALTAARRGSPFDSHGSSRAIVRKRVRSRSAWGSSA